MTIYLTREEADEIDEGLDMLAECNGRMSEAGQRVVDRIDGARRAFDWLEERQAMDARLESALAGEAAALERIAELEAMVQEVPLPHDLDAEAVVLAGIFAAPESLALIRHVLGEEPSGVFFSPAYQAIYNAMLDAPEPTYRAVEKNLADKDMLTYVSGQEALRRLAEIALDVTQLALRNATIRLAVLREQRKGQQP